MEKLFLLVVLDIFPLVFDKSNRGWDEDHQSGHTDLRPPAPEQMPRQGLPCY